MRQREVVYVDEGGMSRYGGVWRRDLGRGKVKSDPVPARLKMHQGLEVGIVYWPASRWEAALMVINRKCAVQRFALCFTDLPEYQQYLLVYPGVIRDR